MADNDFQYIEKSIPLTASTPPPPKIEERSIPIASSTPPPSKSSGDKK